MTDDVTTLRLDLTERQFEALRVAVGWRYLNLGLERHVSPQRVHETVFETTRRLVLQPGTEVTEYQANVILGCLFARVEFLNLELNVSEGPGLRHALMSEVEMLCGILERICAAYFDTFRMGAGEDSGGVARPKSIWPLMSDGGIHEDWAALGG